MLTVLDLFSGIGGFSLGLERTGFFKTVAFCEIEPFCRKVLAKHWPDVPCHEDITKLRGTDIGHVDVVCGGFPCQNLSAAGKREGLSGEKSSLWSEFRRIVGDTRPRVVIVENVAHTWRRWVPTVRSDLHALGRPSVCVQLRASDFGAPHERARCFVVANPDSELLRKFEGRWRRKGREDADELAKSWDYRPVRLGAPNGVSGGAHRRRALGNAVIPQAVELLGNAVAEHFVFS